MRKTEQKEEMMCPMKLTERFQNQLTKQNLEKTIRTMGLRYEQSVHDDGTLSMDWTSYYLKNTCKCLRNAENASAKAIFACVANIFDTFGLSCSEFEYALLYFGDYNSGISPEEIDEIWMLGQNMSKGTICQICCGKKFDIELDFNPQNLMK